MPWAELTMYEQPASVQRCLGGEHKWRKCLRGDLFAAIAAETPRIKAVSMLMTNDIPSVPLTAGLETVLDALHKGAPAAVSYTHLTLPTILRV